MKSFLGYIAILFFLLGCTEYHPKPRGYYRIDLDEKTYDIYQNDDLPCLFEYAQNVSRVILRGSKQDSIWIDIVYPKLNAKIYCTKTSNLQDLAYSGYPVEIYSDDIDDILLMN